MGLTVVVVVVVVVVVIVVDDDVCGFSLPEKTILTSTQRECLRNILLVLKREEIPVLYSQAVSLNVGMAYITQV